MRRNHHCVLAVGQSLLVLLFCCGCGLIDASGKETCPIDGVGFLSNGFDVDVNLEHPQSLSCSQQEQSEIGQIIQTGIEEASKRIYEWETNWKRTFGSASICPSPQQQEGNSTRRRLGSSHNIYRRHLSHQGFFRYYGAMRCSLCFDDTIDMSGTILRKYEVLKYDNATQSMKCHKQWIKSFIPQKITVNGKKEFDLLGTAGTNFTFQATELNTLAEFYVLQFGLNGENEWNGQHIYVSVDGNYIDLGPFYSDEDEGRKSGSISVGISNNNVIEWTMKPGNSASWDAQVHEVNITVPRSMFMNTGTGFLDFGISFGGNANPALTGKINNINQKDVIVVPATECRTGATQGQRYLQRKQQNKGLESGPVSAPVAGPVSSPVSAPRRQHTSNQASDKNKVTEESYSGITDMGGDSQSTGYSYPRHFRLMATSTLTTLLNDIFKTYPFAAGHCMRGVEVDVAVNIEPQPQWEENLPQADQVCGNATISN